MSWQFAYPWVLVFGSVIPVIWVIQAIVFRRKRGMASSVPSRAAAAGVSVRTMTAWIPGLLFSIALLMLVIALARPQETLDHTTITQDAIALELVVDRSGSMEEAVTFGNTRMRRLDAVKTVVERFVVGDGSQLGGRKGDLLGLIVFGTFADTLMPLTQSHDALVEAIRRIELPRNQQERNTAIGDALMLAIARLRASEDAMRIEMEDPEFELKSKAVILLTDGENRTGTYSPDQAAGLAKDWGIKVYIIGIRGGTSINGFFGGGGMQEVNDQKMTAVAQYTGGHYWGINQIADLEGAYAQIDELERSTIERSESTSYRELYFPFAMIGFGAYLFASFLKTIVYRSVL